jgi:hypothetical protein
MNDQQFRSWANRIITCIAAYFVAHGIFLVIYGQAYAR